MYKGIAKAFVIVILCLIVFSLVAIFSLEAYLEPDYPNFELSYDSIDQDLVGEVYYIDESKDMSLDEIYEVNNAKRDDDLRKKQIQVETYQSRGERTKIISGSS